jgi:outer membrane protein assembly factor BamB
MLRRAAMKPEDLVFVTFSRSVVALDKKSGSTEWAWTIPKGSGYNALLVDGEQLFVSAAGYMYCLDARTGTLMWRNDLPGFGTGVPSIAVAGGSTPVSLLAAAARAAAAAAAASSSARG